MIGRQQGCWLLPLLTVPDQDPAERGPCGTPSDTRPGSGGFRHVRRGAAGRGTVGVYRVPVEDSFELDVDGTPVQVQVTREQSETLATWGFCPERRVYRIDWRVSDS
jgi:hypothetical protein